MAITKIPAAGFTGNNFRNIIINGDMSIAQRGTSTSGITSGNTFPCVDRFTFEPTGMGTWTVSQDTDVPSGQGFAKSMKIDCTSADASPASGDLLQIMSKYEGQNLQYLKYGTANAESITMSFWVKSNKTGTYVVNIYSPDSVRLIGGTYTINSSNTWEKKTITFAGDTISGLDNDNNTSFQIHWILGTGSDFTSGTLRTTWTAYTNGDYAAGQTVNLADNTANNFLITGVQLEAGTTASDFEFLPYDVNLQRCQRYFQFIGGVQNANQASGSSTASTTSVFTIHYQTTMRSAPTHSFSDMKITDDVNYDKTISAIAASNSSIYSARVFYTHASGATQYRPASLQPVSTSSTSGITLNAEL